MTVSFKTFGCRLNRAETARYADAFEAAGVRRVPFGADADVVVVHSCAVTRKAETEGLRLLRALRARLPRACLVLSGCTVEACERPLLDALGLDLIVPREQKEELVGLVLASRPPSPASRPPPPAVRRTARADLKIQDGCDFFCAYCIVPHTRGAPVSRAFDACLDEARGLLDAGFQEIVVTGCNIACWREGPRRLPDLLAALAALPGLGRLRLGSLEPGTVEREVLALMAASDRLCRFLHLPLQSGDDDVLRAMGRRYTVGEVSATLAEAARRLPGLGLGSDFICGLPGETPEAFARTLAFAAAHPFSNLHVFPYSERPGTPAAGFPARVPPAERKRRARELIALGAEKRRAFAAACVGRPAALLVERYDREGRACGWSAEYVACRVSGVPRDRRGALVAFTPRAARDGALEGEAAQSSTATRKPTL